MTEQSPQSNTASATGTPDSTSLTERAAALLARQADIRRQRTSADPIRLAVSMPKTFPTSPSAALVASSHDRLTTHDRRMAAARVREAWTAAKAPRRHAEALATRPTADGPWADCYARLRPMLGTGCIIALVGPRGTGKTQLAVSLMRDAVDGDRSARYITAMDLIDEFHAARSGDDYKVLGVMARFASAGVLVIDETQERAGTDFEDRQIVRLIDKRYSHGLVDTVLISNQTPEEFAKSVGSSVIDRMRECGEIVVCDWSSFRRGQR